MASGRQSAVNVPQPIPYVARRGSVAPWEGDGVILDKR